MRLRKNKSHSRRLNGSITKRVESVFSALCKKRGHFGCSPFTLNKVKRFLWILTEDYDHEVSKGQGHEVVVHGGVEVGAPEDDETDRDVAEDTGDKDCGVEEGDDH